MTQRSLPCVLLIGRLAPNLSAPVQVLRRDHDGVLTAHSPLPAIQDRGRMRLMKSEALAVRLREGVTTATPEWAGIAPDMCVMQAIDIP